MMHGAPFHEIQRQARRLDEQAYAVILFRFVEQTLDLDHSCLLPMFLPDAVCCVL
jgi:hypothetical protein